MSRRGNPTRQIELRQRAEDEVGRYASVTAEHSRLKLRCEWEINSSKRMGNTHLFHAMDLAQARRDDVLAIRRQRLADVLASEREEHERMLANLVVTDDQRRERLMQKARDLRVQREEIRRQEAETQRDRLFRNQSSLVREAESKIKILSVADQRQQQIVERQRLRAEQEAEDRFFAEQAMALQNAQAARAQSDLETLHVKAAKMRQDLQLQADHNVHRKVNAKQRDIEEDKAFMASVQRGLEAEQAQEAARRAKQREIADTTKSQNTIIKAEKEAELARLRELEKKELDDLLERIAADEQVEAQRKRKARDEAAEHIKLVEAQMNAAAASETALDRLWTDESDRQWAKREEEWQRNELARQRLMVDVYNSRRAQIGEIRQKEMELQEKRRRDLAEATAESIGSLGLDRSEAAERRRRALENQAYLQAQIDRKQAIKDKERNEKSTELTAAQAEEAAYQAKIQFELSKLENAKPAAYQNVRLSSTKRGLI